MQTLYPEIKPYARHELAVEPPHVLYVDESGSADGLPVLFIHGGPGAGCDAASRRYFDPALYRIVTFDQRGCGRSTPHASLENNTTQALIGDIERIREQLGIDKFVLFGGSWGSTLALAYAQAYPQRVHGLILRGIFLCRPQEFSWFYQEGASRLFPDYWEDYVAPIPPEERGDLMQAFYKRLTGTDQIAQMHAAKAWSTWEGDAPPHCARTPRWWSVSAMHTGRCQSPGSSVTTSSTMPFSNRTNCFATWRKLPTYRASSCTAATTPSARWTTPGRCIRPGPTVSCRSSAMPATRLRSLVSPTR